MSASSTKSEELQETSQLVRKVQAAMKVAIPDDDEIRFRSSLLNYTTTRLGELSENQITRLYESACEVKFPSPEVAAFRKSLQHIIGLSLNLKNYRAPKPTTTAK